MLYRTICTAKFKNAQNCIWENGVEFNRYGHTQELAHCNALEQLTTLLQQEGLLLEEFELDTQEFKQWDR